MNCETIHVLLIEDNQDYVRIIKELLMGERIVRFNIESADRLSSGIRLLSRQRFDVVLLDLTLPDSDGLGSLVKIEEQAPTLPIVVLTGQDDESIAVQSLREGAQDYLIKGDTNNELLVRSVRYAVERNKIRLERQEAEKQLKIQKEFLERANRELEAANEKLRELNQLKSNFVSSVSHELRTPLTVIMSSANNLVDGAFGDLTELQKKWIRKIDYHSNRLHEMINNILDLSKLESGKIDLRWEAVDVGRHIETITGNMRLLADDKKINLECTIPEKIDRIWADSGRIEQVLINLITNAMKFTPEQGNIQVSAQQNHKKVRVTVRDTGPGIAPEYHESIFDRFQQVKGDNNQPKGSTKGIGLGLTICKEIVSLHQGRIWVESECGKGSQFIFEIPVDLRSSGKTSKNILVVDDDDDVCQLLEITLLREKYKVTTCHSGDEAIQLIQQTKKIFGLIFLDLMLPGSSGVDVVQYLRGIYPDIPIVIITAYPNSDALFKAMSHAPLTIVSKPFNPQHIVETVEKFLPMDGKP